MDRILTRLSQVLLFLLSLLLPGCTGRATVSAIDIQVLSAREYYDEVLAIAREWQPDAYLQFANANVIQPYYSRRPLRLSYSFLSKSERSKALLVWIHEDLTIESEVVYIGGSAEGRQEIQSEQWVLDDMDAIQIAQEAGGNEYINKYRSVEITAYLEYRKRGNDDTVIWRVSYLRPEGDGSIHIEVDAITGEVLEIRE